MINNCILHSLLWAKESELGDLRRRYERKLTLRPRYGEDTEPVQIFARKNGMFGFPRHYLPAYSYQVGRDLRSEGHSIAMESTSQPRDYQESFLLQGRTLIDAGVTGLIVEADPAFGKTVCVIDFMARIGRTALVLVPKTDLIEQWQSRIVEHSSLKASDVGYVEGRTAVWKGKSVVVALVHSLAIGYLGKDFMKYFGQVWADEIHSSVPPKTFAPLGSMFPAKWRGGASATLDRKDGMHVVFQYHFQQELLRGHSPSSTFETPTIFVIKYRGHKEPFPPWLVNPNQRRGVLISRLAEDPSRNVLLAKGAMKVYKTGRQFCILSDRIDQLGTLKKLLIGLGAHSRDIGWYSGQALKGNVRYNVSKKELQHAAENCGVLLATYGMLKQGTDIPTLSGIVYATPQSDIRQTEGRIQRILEGKKSPVEVDVLDEHYPETMRWWDSRKRHYARRGCQLRRLLL